MAWYRRLSGALDAGALERAFAAIVRRHDSLRTTFHSHDGEPYQRVEPPADFHLARIDLGGLAPDTQAARLSALCAEDALRPFDLERDLPLRATLIRLGDREHVLLLAMHHIASDGASIGVLERELRA